MSALAEAIEPSKTLFVICPIGVDGSAERKASDELLEYVIDPVTRQTYKIERADKIIKTGSITSQIFDLLISADIVIADMTGHNANVFYELAVRHAVGKPVIHMIATGGKGIPFDVADQRAIYYTLSLDGAKLARDSLARMILEIERGDEEPPSPISIAVQRKLMMTPSPSAERRDSEMMAMLSDIRQQVSIITEDKFSTPAYWQAANTLPMVLADFCLVIYEAGGVSPDMAEVLAQLCGLAIGLFKTMSDRLAFPEQIDASRFEFNELTRLKNMRARFVEISKLPRQR